MRVGYACRPERIGSQANQLLASPPLARNVPRANIRDPSYRFRCRCRFTAARITNSLLLCDLCVLCDLGVTLCLPAADTNPSSWIRALRPIARLTCGWCRSINAEVAEIAEKSDHRASRKAHNGRPSSSSGYVPRWRSSRDALSMPRRLVMIEDLPRRALREALPKGSTLSNFTGAACTGGDSCLH